MKGNFVRALIGVMTLSASLCVEALATVESRTGDPVTYSAEPVVRSSVEASSAPAEDRAALLSLKQLEALKQEISELRGLLETQDHEIQQLKKSQQDFYTDLDKRVNQLQPAKGAAASKTTAKTAIVVPAAKGKPSITIVPIGTTSAPATPGVPTEELIEEPMANDLLELPSAVNKKGETDHVAEKAAYESAYDLVRAKRYSEATAAFQNYLTQFKNGDHAAKAHYWMGEIYMAQWQQDPKNKGLLDKAAQAFSNIASQFPGNPKVSDALLKLGIIENEKGNLPAARKYFTDVKNRYPGSAAARIAETRLKQ